MSGCFELLLKRRVLDEFAANFRPALARRMDGRAVRVAVLLAIIAILNCLDLSYTLLAHRAGLLRELNPIAANFLNMGLEPSLICYKFLTLLVGSSILWKVRRSSWAPGACWLLVIVYVWLSIVWCAWTNDFSAAIDNDVRVVKVAQLHMPEARLAAR